jgi:D-arabinose 1-dehydrogenase-like Zn-dependent alcohol dehydrogenase
MRAMVLHTPASIDSSPLLREDVAPPSPGPHDVVVRVETCGVCRTDLHVVEGELPPVKSPVIPGHQVVERGAEIPIRTHTETVPSRRRTRRCSASSTIRFAVPPC